MMNGKRSEERDNADQAWKIIRDLDVRGLKVDRFRIRSSHQSSDRQVLIDLRSGAGSVDI